MEEQKKPVDAHIDTQPEVTLVDKEPVVAAVESAPTTPPARQKNQLFTIAAIVLVVIALAAVWLRLEREGRVETSIFSGIIASQEAGAPVAVVNGDELIGSDLELSIEQLSQAAAAQGRNPQDEATQAEIRTLAIDMLVNTTLLQQAAVDEGVVITDEQVAERIQQLEEESGGAEVLAARMEEFEIDRETFEQDVKTELTIVTLLDQVFAEADLTVTEEELQAVYQQAGGGQPGAPALEEVRTQIEAQIRQVKEQEAVNVYLEELRSAADIEIVS